MSNMSSETCKHAYKNNCAPATIYVQNNDMETSEQKGENDNSECAESNKSKESEMQLPRSGTSNVTKTKADKSLHSDSEIKRKINSLKVGQIVFARLKPKGTKKNTNLIYYPGE